MIKYFKICLMLTISVLWSIKSNAQSSSGNNTYGGAKFLGWNSTNDLSFKIGPTTPTLLMTLKSGGDLDLSLATKVFQIGGNSILWHNGDPTSIFAGVGAGASAPASGTLYKV